MTTIVFLHGAGAGAYDEDARMVAGLARHLGDHDTIDYPRLPEEDDGDDQAWHRVIGHALERARGPVYLVAHSAGGYVAVKHLATHPAAAEVAGLFLIAAPFPGGDPEWTFPGFELPEDFGRALPAGMPVYLYAAEDDEVVPFAHRDLYAAAIRGAVGAHRDRRAPARRRSRRRRRRHPRTGGVPVTARPLRDVAPHRHPKARPNHMLDSSHHSTSSSIRRCAAAASV